MSASLVEPVLRTERLELWRAVPSDLAGMIELIEPEAMRRFLAPGPDLARAQFERLLRNAGSWSLHGYGTCVVRYIDRPEIVGTCGVFRSWRGFGRGMDDIAEAGWIIGEAHWGKGLAGEAMHAVLAWYDATHGPGRLACMIAKGNIASERLAATLGFVEYDRFQPEGDEVELGLYERF